MLIPDIPVWVLRVAGVCLGLPLLFFIITAAWVGAPMVALSIRDAWKDRNDHYHW